MEGAGFLKLPKNYAKLTELIDQWKFEEARNRMWHHFLQFGCTHTGSIDSYVRVVADSRSSSTDVNIHLLRLMYAVSTGSRVLNESGESSTTSLETALESFTKLRFMFVTDELRRKANLVEILIKEQAVLVCCRQRDFTRAKLVFSRLWAAPCADKVIERWLSKVLKAKMSETSIDKQSPYSRLVEETQILLKKVLLQFEQPFLIQIAHRVFEVMSSTPANLHETGMVLSKSDLIEMSALMDIHVPEDTCSFFDEKDQPQFRECILAARSAKTWERRQLTHDEVQKRTLRSMAPDRSAEPSVNADSTYSGSSSRQVGRSLRGANQSGNASITTDVIAETCESSDDESVKSLTTRLGVTRPRASRRLSTIDTSWDPHHRKGRSFSRRCHKPWSAMEEERVYLAVQQFGVGNWAAIVSSQLIPGRSNMDIKDKWRTMCKQKRDKVLSKKLQSISD